MSPPLTVINIIEHYYILSILLSLPPPTPAPQGGRGCRGWGAQHGHPLPRPSASPTPFAAHIITYLQKRARFLLLTRAILAKYVIKHKNKKKMRKNLHMSKIFSIFAPDLKPDIYHILIIHNHDYKLLTIINPFKIHTYETQRIKKAPPKQT